MRDDELIDEILGAEAADGGAGGATSGPAREEVAGVIDLLRAAPEPQPSGALRDRVQGIAREPDAAARGRGSGAGAVGARGPLATLARRPLPRRLWAGAGAAALVAGIAAAVVVGSGSDNSTRPCTPGVLAGTSTGSSGPQAPGAVGVPGSGLLGGTGTGTGPGTTSTDTTARTSPLNGGTASSQDAAPPARSTGKPGC